ncbi:MAG: phage holin family protein [Muribaculaceae bacterium]|nr:phage holin family protein [Muribaculaceae bacterium]
MTDNNSSGSFQDFLATLRRYIILQLDYARLSGAEKLTVLLSTLLFGAMVLIFGSIMLVFISIGVGHLLAMTVAPYVAYLYVAGFYFILFICLFIFRKQLFTDPVARMISRLFVKPPKR